MTALLVELQPESSATPNLKSSLAILRLFSESEVSLIMTQVKKYNMFITYQKFRLFRFQPP